MKGKKTAGSDQFSLKLETPTIRKNTVDDTKKSATVTRLIDPKTREIRKQAKDRVLASGVFAIASDER